MKFTRCARLLLLTGFVSAGFVLAGACTSFAANIVGPQVPEVRIAQEIDGQKTPVDWKFKIEPLWAINSEGGHEFYWGISLRFPSRLPVSTVLDQHADVGFTKGGQVGPSGLTSLYIKMTSMTDHFTVVFDDKSRVDFEIELVLEKPLSIVQGCFENNIRVEPRARAQSRQGIKVPAEPVQVPTYIAVKCEKSDTGVLLAVSVPEETAWKSSSIFESKGKGKRWRNFELNPQVPLSGKDMIGTFDFVVNGKIYPYAVFVEKREEKRDVATFHFSLGAISLIIASQGQTDAIVKPAAHVGIELRPWRPELSLGGQGISSLPSVQGANFFTHTESIGYIGYTFGLKGRWSFEPRVYAYLADGISQKLQFYYTLNMAAAGFETRFKISESSQMTLEAFGMKSANQSLASVRLDWSRNFVDTKGSWGLNAVFQSIGANLASPLKGTATQAFVGPFLDF